MADEFTLFSVYFWMAHNVHNTLCREAKNHTKLCNEITAEREKGENEEEEEIIIIIILFFIIMLVRPLQIVAIAV